MFDFVLTSCDTDSITICKKDGAPYSQSEINDLTNKLNSLFDENIKWDFEFYIPKFIVLKAKNYIIYDGKKIKLKGSSLKDSKKEAAIREMSSEIIDSLVFNKDAYQNVYLKYIKEAMNIKDIKRWSSKKSLSDKVFTSERANETKIKDAVEGTDYREGDKVWLYFKSDDSLGLAEKFDGDYNKDKMLEKLYKATEAFDSVLPEGLFKNYKLKKNKQELEIILNEHV